MQPKKSQSPGKGILLGMAVLFLAGAVVFSCRKNVASETQVARKTQMDEIARLLNGDLRSGSLAGADDENELALDYNNGGQFILVDKLPGAKNIRFRPGSSVELITSRYGIVIRDLGNNKLLLLANNDEESIRRFDAVRSLLQDGYESVMIFGTTLVNPERS